MEETQANKIEEYEELKIKVRPKLVLVMRELADVEKILKAFQNKHEAGGKPVFTKTPEFYFEALKFDSSKIMDALDGEIEVMKRELDKMQQLRLERIKSVQECVQEFTNLMQIKQPPKVKELSEFMSLPENQFQ